MAKSIEIETPHIKQMYEEPPAEKMFRGGDHSKGVSKVPSYNTDPSQKNSNGVSPGQKKFCFGSIIADGESPNMDGKVNVQNANGTASSRGQNKGAKWNSEMDSSDGDWNRNEPFDGANLTGF